MSISIVSLKSAKAIETKSDGMKVSIGVNPEPCEMAEVIKPQAHKAPVLFAHNRQQAIAPLLATTTDQEQHITHRIH